LLSLFVCSLILAAFLASSEVFVHWFVIPLWLSGVIIGRDAIDWLRGHCDVYDPVGILGLLGLHFFFLSGMLHVHWDTWLLYVVPPSDWRTWLGVWGIVNVAGLLLYRLTYQLIPLPLRREAPAPYKRLKTVWRPDLRAFFLVGSTLLVITALLQVYVYASFGGIMAYIQTATNDLSSNSDSMQGMGMLFMISESFPICALMMFAVFARNRENLRSWPVIVIVLLAYLILMLLFGGLRGSRSNTIWGLFWGVGIIHFWLRRIPRNFIYLGIVFVVMFMYVYGFYKGAGLEGVRSFATSESITDLEEDTGRGLESLLLFDLGRADIQAFLIHRIEHPESDYELAMGRTYYAAVTILIPRSFIDRPYSKSYEGTEAMFGRGSYDPDNWVTSKVFGIAGEALLNFGVYAMPFTYIIVGMVVGLVRRLVYGLDEDDMRRLFLPYLVNFCFMLIVSDFDNMIFNTFKSMFVPFMLIFLGSIRQTFMISVERG
jgi:hypothetical protein